MEWQSALLLILGSLVVLMLSGMPVAFCFLILNLIWIFFFCRGELGLVQLALNMGVSVTTFTLLAVPLFIFMGEVMLRSEIGPFMMDAIDKWLGRLPGRLSLLAVGGGTLFATLTGVSMASVAMLGSVLVPEMEKRGYRKPMTLGPILGSGGLAVMIPPSSLAVFIAAIGQMSAGKLLMAIIVPGLLMAALFAAYIILRCLLQPSIAPAYAVTPATLSDKLKATAVYILPLGFIIFLVIGVMFLGIATPSEAAATGTAGAFILAASYRKLNWQMVKKSIAGTLEMTGMIFMIIIGAAAFGGILAFSGAARGMVEFTLGLSLPPISIVIAMMVVLIMMGMFMDAGSITMITLPLFMPILNALGFNPEWFGVLFLINMQVGMISPPFGLSLFVMQGVASPGTTFTDCWRASLPFVYCDLIAIALILVFPVIALWLPGIMIMK